MSIESQACDASAGETPTPFEPMEVDASGDGQQSASTAHGSGGDVVQGDGPTTAAKILVYVRSGTGGDSLLGEVRRRVPSALQEQIDASIRALAKEY